MYNIVNILHTTKLFGLKELILHYSNSPANELLSCELSKMSTRTEDLIELEARSKDEERQQEVT